MGTTLAGMQCRSYSTRYRKISKDCAKEPGTVCAKFQRRVRDELGKTGGQNVVVTVVLQPIGRESVQSLPVAARFS